MDKLLSKITPRKSLSTIRPSISSSSSPNKSPNILDFSVKTYSAAIKVEEVTS